MPRLRRLESLWLLSGLLGTRTSPHGVIGWRDVIRLSDEHGLTPALAVALDGNTAVRVPQAVRRRILLAHRRNVARNLLLRRESTEAISALNERGVEPLLFKGALYLVEGTFAPGVRFMGDIDIVVPEASMRPATDALRSLGYAAAPGKPFLHPHELPFVRPGAQAPIEVHADLGSSRVASALPLAHAWAASRIFDDSGLRYRGLSRTDAVVHNVLHAQVQDLNHAVHGIALRQLHTLAGLERAWGAEIDWAAARARLGSHGLGGVYDGYILLAHRLFGMPLPAGVTPTRDSRYHLCLAAFQMGWPADVQRNLRYALGSDYMEHLYGCAGHPLGLTRARARHLLSLVRARGGNRVADLRAPTR